MRRLVDNVLDDASATGSTPRASVARIAERAVEEIDRRFQ